MSLHHIAKNLETKGRGPDSVLVHMSPKEVGGLQALAKAQGGSLTRNPETGLYEAGFLNQILPIVAAAAATYFTAGAAAPALAAAMGGGAAATAGAGILAGAGAGALISGGTAAITGKDVGKAALMGGVGGAISGGLGAYDGAASADLLTGAAPTDAVATVPTDGIAAIPTDAGATAPTGIDGLQTGATNATAGSATNAPMTQQQFADTSAFTGTPQAPGSVPASMPSPTIQNTPTSAELTNLQAGGPQAPNVTPKAFGTPDSYYGNLAKDSYVQKAGIQALPTLGLWEDQQKLATTPEEQSKMRRISPNFYGQDPVQPNPYYHATYAAEGGIMRLAEGGMPPVGPVGQMSQNNMGGQGNMFPQSQQEHTNFATPTQMPASAEVIRSDYDAKTDPYTGVMMAEGGITDLGSYSDGGRLLKGPGDGVSDNIPATIGGHQPARLADGEFVVPARIVSELGNGSTDAGAKRLYAMMERVQAKRKKSMGKGKFAVNSKADKDLPV